MSQAPGQYVNAMAAEEIGKGRGGGGRGDKSDMIDGRKLEGGVESC